MGESAEQLAAPATTGITAPGAADFLVAGLVVALTQLGFFITAGGLAALPPRSRRGGGADRA